eukprot:CAMPEP_0177680244 /NCGR_PEP_ID=MMETSP0447-20121125/30066_1 /TAXON_ID=0 /ORGANISM="Stygamoeba regulata, Strain BSH-02190019" /LENGTH=484 /DNA_ID=CAMNT_0019189555 /DNA_START=171 /DNA_END=1626 /DNA_ORIENTATION=+
MKMRGVAMQKLSVLVNAKKVQHAWDLFCQKVLEEAAFRPDTNMCNFMLTGLGRAGLGNEATILYRAMKVNRIPRTIITLTNVLNALSKAKHQISWSTAEGIVAELKADVVESSLKPAIVFYNDLQHEDSQRGLFQRGLEELTRSRRRMDIVTATLVMNWFSTDLGRDVDAIDLFMYIATTTHPPPKCLEKILPDRKDLCPFADTEFITSFLRLCSQHTTTITLGLPLHLALEVGAALPRLLSPQSKGEALARTLDLCRHAFWAWDVTMDAPPLSRLSERDPRGFLEPPTPAAALKKMRPQVATVAMLTSVCYKCQRFEATEDIMLMLRARGIAPDPPLLALLCRLATHSVVAISAPQVSARGFKLSTEQRADLLRLMLHRQRVVKSVWDMFGGIYDFSAHTTLVDYYTAIHDVQAALAALEDMSEKGFVPNWKTFSKMMHLCEVVDAPPTLTARLQNILDRHCIVANPRLPLHNSMVSPVCHPT